MTATNLKQPDDDPYCDICGWGLAGYNDGDLAICRSHSKADIERWKKDGAITYTQREKLCDEVSGALLFPASEADRRKCDTAHKETNLDCPDCPFTKGWEY